MMRTTALILAAAIAGCCGMDPVGDAGTADAGDAECFCTCGMLDNGGRRAKYERWPMPRAGKSVEDVCRMRVADVIGYMAAHNRCQGLMAVNPRACRFGEGVTTTRVCSWVGTCPGALFTASCLCRPRKPPRL